MATKQQISIKLLVEKEKNRLVYAECYQDFVDLLFSFLMLPMGSVIRLLRCHQSMEIEGCMRKLYNSVYNLSSSYLWTDACKHMLLSPQVASAEKCRKLKFNIADAIHWYVCGRFSADCMLSATKDARCPCGLLTSVKTFLEQANDARADVDGVFVKGGFAERYIITDDLQVMPGSISNCMIILEKLGIGDDVSKTEERIVNVKWKEIFKLLEHSWCSQTPLTDVFISNQEPVETAKVEVTGITRHGDDNKTSIAKKTHKVKLIRRISTKTFLYAEAGHDFIDQLFSFLTFPLGSVFNLFSGKFFLKGSIHNIYTSVKELSSNGCIKPECETLLVNPKLPLYSGCESQLLCIEEDHQHPCYTCTKERKNYVFDKYFTIIEELAGSNSNARSEGNESSFINEGLVLMNPKSLFPDAKTGGGFVKEPSKFMVTDDLVVTLYSPISIQAPYRLQPHSTAYIDLTQEVTRQHQTPTSCTAYMSHIALVIRLIHTALDSDSLT